MVKIAFIQEELRARFGVMTLAAVLKKGGHECDVFIREKAKDVIDEAVRYRPDIIAFSTMTAGIDFALAAARKLKERCGSFILMGGPHPTFYPEVIEEDCIDGICRGEGEFAFLELADSLNKGRDITAIKNMWIKKEGTIYKNELRPLIDINELPLPDRGLYFDKYRELREEPTKRIFVGRGCPFACTYCFNHILKRMYSGKGAYVRLPRREKIISEIRYVRDSYSAKWIQLNADTPNVDRRWFLDFLEEYKSRINLPFICNVRIDRVDEEMVRKMKEAGCDRVDFAVESGDENMLKNILRRDMTGEQIIRGGLLFKKYGIRVMTSNIVGAPYETLATVMKTLELNRKIKPEIANCFVLQPYPRTDIHKFATEHGFLEKTYRFSAHGDGFQIGFDTIGHTVPLKLGHRRQLENLVYFFNLLVRYEWLEPVIKLLINLPPNRIFRLIYAFPTIKQDAFYSKSLKKQLKAVHRILKILLLNR